MRIYDGSPRQNWEEVLRSIGAFADRERLKELLFLELEDGFLLQGMGVPAGGADSDTMGTLSKRTYELLDDQVAQLIDEATAKRGTVPDGAPHLGIDNYYEQAMRIVGAWVDEQKSRDVFFFEQDGSFVMRTLQAGSGGVIGHQLAEFTKDEIVAMIEAAPQHRDATPEKPAATPETTK